MSPLKSAGWGDVDGSRILREYHITPGRIEGHGRDGTPLLKLKYHDSIADPVADLGPAPGIGAIFSGFQRYLYQEQAATA